MDKTMRFAYRQGLKNNRYQVQSRHDTLAQIQNPKSEIPMLNTDNLTIADFQQFIRDRYYATDKARGTPKTYMWFIEEVGELATALQKFVGEGGNTSGGENLEEEFADVFAWLCTLANINDIDLTAAIQRKYGKDGGPEGTK
jgi:NTP pyrophosphatase (non-canonical NTP hydrolase)